MPRKARELTDMEVKRLVSQPGVHFVGGVAGLALKVAPSGAASWVLRARVLGRRRDIGLGSYGLNRGVTLAKARTAADEARDQIRAKGDPIEQGRKLRSEARAARAAAITFKDAAEQYIESKAAEWSNAKHADQWRNTLTTYAYPTMGAMLVRDIDLPQVLKVLEPIWKEKTETATRIRGRIEGVLDWATTRKLREGLNPARWRGHLANLLPLPSKISKVEHHKALGIDAIGVFMAELRQQKGMGARALEFAILTAARSGEVRGATWPEIDLDSATWTIPASRMKAGKEHRVPLSDAAMRVLEGLPRIAETDLVFPSVRNTALSDMTLTAVLRRMDTPAVPHGFRSTFRDWCSERTNYPGEVAEMALAHTIGNATEAAYRRGELFDKRRHLMADWAAFCAKPEVKNTKVIPIRQSTSITGGRKP